MIFQESSMPAPRAFLFDMDGLLLDTEQVHTHAFMEMSARYGKPQPAQIFINTIGQASLETTRWLVEEVGIDADPQAMVYEELEIYYRMLAERRPKPLSGVEEMFALGEKHGLKRALVSSSLREQVNPTMEIVLDHLGKKHPPAQWHTHFDAVCTGDRVQHRKPAPDLYLLAINELRLAPQDCIAFEDSPAGVSAAHAAGVRVVAVPNIYLKDRDVAQNKAEWVCETLLDAHTTLRLLFE
jgi:beta-phosphoglucomutase-like phosphatase (HAD superfamily)